MSQIQLAVSRTPTPGATMPRDANLAKLGNRTRTEGRLGEKQTRINDALLAAVRAGDPATVERLLSRGANPESRETHGPSALQLAGQLGNKEIAMLLKKGGASV